MSNWKKPTVYISSIILVFLCVLLLLSIGNKPEKIVYGSSFSATYTKELGLNPNEVYVAILDDLKVRNLRLSAYWNTVESVQDTFDFSELDFQINEAEKRGANVILSVGRRLPRWPECHVPEWANTLSWEEQKQEIKELITATVERYKGSEAIIYWQVENEPFLDVFATEQCGDLDKEFLAEEIALVKKIDSTRLILVTDSGNLGSWFGAYKSGDIFGTSAYLYFWNPEIGPFKSILPPAYYIIKNNIMRIIYGSKPSLLIELSIEPWLIEPIINTPIETQLERMDIEKFEEIISFAERTKFDTQYLWGAEWWYWLKLQGEESFWLRAKELYSENN